MGDVANNLKKAITDLNRALDKANSDDYVVDNIDLSTFGRAFSLVEELRSKLPNVAGGKISDFFEEVGEGLIHAQKELDVKSQQYNLDRGGYAPPTQFRIPKVDAMIKFATAENKSKGFNVLLFGSKTTASQSQQNSVSFEIAAVPPPPDFTAGLPIQAGLITGFAERAFVRDTILKLSAEKGFESVNPDYHNKIANEFDDILVLVDPDGRWLLLANWKTKNKDSWTLVPLIVDRSGGSNTTEFFTPKTKIGDVHVPTGRPKIAMAFFMQILEVQRKMINEFRAG